MRPEEARIGRRVLAPGNHRVRELRGRVRTIMRIFKAPDRTALHVRFGDGVWQLFWPEELEAEDGGGEASQGGGRRGGSPPRAPSARSGGSSGRPRGSS